MGPIRREQRGEIQPAVPDVAVRVAETSPGPVDDAGEAPASPQQVEVLIVAVDERLPSRRGRQEPVSGLQPEARGWRASRGKRTSLSR